MVRGPWLPTPVTKWANLTERLERRIGNRATDVQPKGG